MSAARFTKVAPRQLEDATAERARRDQAQALQELQARVGKVNPNARFYLGRRVFSTSTRYEPTPGTKAVLLRMVGGGGGGGGTTGGAGALDASSGGAAGVFLEVWIANAGPIQGGAIVIGAAGAGGTAGGGTGGTGGDTVVTIAGRSFTAKGGPGGLAMGSGATNSFQAHTAIQAGSSSGDFTVAEGGTGGMRLAATSALAGRGGSNPFGCGGTTAAADTTGTPGNGYGSGGGGAVATATNRAGGAGRPGLVIIEEFA